MARKRIFNRLPKIFSRLDDQETLEKFLGVIDTSFDGVHLKTSELLELRDILKIPNSWLTLAADTVGHVWRKDKSYSWNRQRITDSINRYSYKGTYVSVDNLAKEYGSLVNTMQDNASKLLVLGKQGRLGCDDAYLVSADYWHDGAFLAQFASTGDREGLSDELPSLIPAGQVWYIEFVYVTQGILDTYALFEFEGTLTFTNALQGAVGFGTLGGNLLLSSEPNGQTDASYLYTGLGEGYSKPIGSIGFGQLGTTLYLSNEATIAPEMSYDPMLSTFMVDDRSLGYAALGRDLFLSVEPAT